MLNDAPHCLLIEDQLVSELRMVGFVPDPSVSLRKLNLPIVILARDARNIVEQPQRVRPC